MNKENYEAALKHWNEMLSIFPRDVEAAEGKRRCLLAIENRLKFEKIRSFFAQGKKLYDGEQYQLARIEFDQVLKIDPTNRDARNYIVDIDEKIEERRLYQERLQQAEDFYISGINSVKAENFDQAQEDFESALALVENYKDAKDRLKSIEGLRKAYIEREKFRRIETIDREFQDGLLALSDGRYNDAIAAFSKTLYLDPQNKQAQKYLSQAKEAQRQLEEEIVDRNSPYYDVINALSISGVDLFKKKRYDESMKKWDHILELFTKNREAQHLSP
jgi:tetratricopeptide (TPR) repeat protein